MATSNLPLPEITTDDFERSWTRFHLVAAASKWDDDPTGAPAQCHNKLFKKKYN